MGNHRNNNYKARTYHWRLPIVTWPGSVRLCGAWRSWKPGGRRRPCARYSRRTFRHRSPPWCRPVRLWRPSTRSAGWSACRRILRSPPLPRNCGRTRRGRCGGGGGGCCSGAPAGVVVAAHLHDDRYRRRGPGESAAGGGHDWSRSRDPPSPPPPPPLPPPAPVQLVSAAPSSRPPTANRESRCPMAFCSGLSVRHETTVSSSSAGCPSSLLNGCGTDYGRSKACAYYYSMTSMTVHGDTTTWSDDDCKGLPTATGYPLRKRTSRPTTWWCLLPRKIYT